MIENKVCIITRSISVLRLGSCKYTTTWRSVIGYTLDCLKMNWNYDCWLGHAFFIILQWKLIVLYNEVIIFICFRQFFSRVHPPEQRGEFLDTLLNKFSVQFCATNPRTPFTPGKYQQFSFTGSSLILQLVIKELILVKWRETPVICVGDRLFMKKLLVPQSLYWSKTIADPLALGSYQHYHGYLMS